MYKLGRWVNNYESCYDDWQVDEARVALLTSTSFIHPLSIRSELIFPCSCLFMFVETGYYACRSWEIHLHHSNVKELLQM